MTRATSPTFEPFDGNTFMQFAMNGIGALIILALIVGERARHIPLPPAPAPAKEQTELQANRLAAGTLEGDLHRLAGEIDVTRAEAARRFMERDQLSTIITGAERELADRRAALDKKSQRRYDLQRDVTLAKADLERLASQRQTAEAVPETTLKIESYPTPISKPVDDKEAHFRIKGNRVAYVPLNELLGRLKGVFQEKAWKLKDQDEFTDTIGPIDGFHMRYTVEKLEVPWEEAVATGRGGSYVTLSMAEFVPVNDELGEMIDVALDNHSSFRGRLDELNPKRYTITLWIYPDSFEAFRKLRKELYQMGYSIAARPMPEGKPIGGSPNGSKSAAE